MNKKPDRRKPVGFEEGSLVCVSVGGRLRGRPFAQVGIEGREGTEEHNREDILHSLDVGVEVRQCMEFLHKAYGDQVLP